MRIVFMGTPDFAAVVLRHLTVWCGRTGLGEVVAVYCRPDRPAGRGHKLQAPPVKLAALDAGLPVFQPVNFRNEADLAALAALQPDVLAVAAYGLVLPRTVLDIPRLGPFNVHASLLPRLRGAAPIQRSIMDGDVCTGITIMRMEAGLDTGPMLAQRALAVGPDETAGELETQLADLGGRLLAETLERMAGGEAVPEIAQDNDRATYAARLTKADGLVRWDLPADRVHARLRGVTPRPGGRSVIAVNGRELPVLLQPGRVGPLLQDAGRPDAAPGDILGLSEQHLVVACADRVYLVPALRPADKGFMDAAAFWNGRLRGHEARMLPPDSPDVS